MKYTNAQEQPATPTTVMGDGGGGPHFIERYTDLFDSHQMTLPELASKIQLAGPRLPPRLTFHMTEHGPAGGSAD